MNNKVDETGCPIIETEDKNWPDNNEMAMFMDIADPIREALQVAIEKGDKVYEEGIEWTGLEQGFSNSATIPNPSEMLHAYHLKYSNERQGRDVYTEIIGIAVQLGMEQGRRQIIEKLKSVEINLSALLSLTSNNIKMLKIIIKDHNRKEG